MFINLSDVFNMKDKVSAETAVLEMEQFSSRLGDFTITEKSPVQFRFTNTGINRVKVEGSVDLTFLSACDLCLIPVEVKLPIQFDREICLRDENTVEDDDLEYLDGYQLDVETFVYDEILVNWPVKILCKSDCKGICPVCGKNLNEGDCTCDRFVPDPRMAAIQDIFNANKEV